MTRFGKTALLSATILTAAAPVSAEIINGHLLDENKTVVENAMKVQNFSTLVAAVKAAGLDDDLMGEGPYTILAPTDAAFAELPEGTVEELLKPENMAQLESLLRAHVIPAELTHADIDKLLLDDDDGGLDIAVTEVEGEGFSVDTLTIGTDVTFKKVGDATYVSSTLGGEEVGIKIIEGDIAGSNGVIHVIDGVLMPAS
ncbi:fasciclin domain-containing protein [Poseidonocella sedimentorum]|uniref:Uncaracterized surface protein containing fasciclin (FAS1) repeats n=1 Tax=Poseidonocella sedimentorum TaxID=871652 RepID=A0A1I6DQ33_9RHOB|nr:fasciclin domain-containing protein [Poseidonocella sedimentorum]SFR07549.1 Uncaracterized surface protein containing fasciclin (FAS1) repeats [Poseidonocella sedimentorum]